MRTRLLTIVVCAALLALAVPGEAAVPPEDPQHYLAITGFGPDPEREGSEVVATLTNVGDRPLTAWVVQYGGREYGSRTRRSSDLVDNLGDPTSPPNRLLPGETATVLIDPRLKHSARVVAVVFEDGQFAGDAEQAHKIFRRRARNRQDLRLWLDALMQARLEMATLDDPRPPIRALIEDQELVKVSAGWRVPRSIQSALEMALVAPQILPKGDTLAAVDELIDAAVLGIEGLDRAIPPTFDGLTFPPLASESEPIVEEEPGASASTGAGAGAGSCTLAKSRTRHVVRNCLTFNITEDWLLTCSNTGQTASKNLMGQGKCNDIPPWVIDCPPEFYGGTEYLSGPHLVWDRQVEHQKILAGPFSVRCDEDGSENADHMCFNCNPPSDPGEGETPDTQHEGHEGGCSTLVLDLGGDGFRPSVPAIRVAFDLDGDGRRESVPWLAGSDDAFLALDRNGNGSIDDGTELFSDHNKQPASYRQPNGFDALAVFDSRNAGGDGDGQITAADAIYPHLVLWLDRNRDGESTPSELVSLAAEGVAAIDLEVWSAPAVTESGEVLRYWGGYLRDDGGTGYAVDAFFSSPAP